jgi:signal transduction histidine kinase
MMGPRSLQRRLLAVVVLALAPIVVLSVATVVLLARQQSLEIRNSAIQTMRAMGGAVDTELARLTSVLQTLAANDALDHGDLLVFRATALRVKEADPAWANIILADVATRQLVNLVRPPGTPLPTSALWPAPFKRALAERRAVIGPLVPFGPIIREPVFTIDVPVLRGDKVLYMLTGIVRPAALSALIVKQHVPAEGVVSILDADGKHIARSRAHNDWVGKAASATLQDLMRRGAEGWGASVTLEGQSIYAAFSRSALTGWTVAVGIPRDAIDGPIRRSYVTLGSAIALSLAVGLIAAVVAARSVSRPMQALRAAAQALGRGERPAAPLTKLPEVREVADALTAAGEARREAEHQREALLRREQDARAAAEEANHAKDEFLAVLSHELRTPLNAVYGWARMLRMGELRSDRVDRALEAIERNANAQVQLIDDLLDVSRVVTGKMRLELRSVDPALVVEAALDAVRPAADAKAIGVRSTIDPSAGPVAGDPDRLRQVVWNLLMNAVKFTPRGGAISVLVQRVNEHVEIVVSDTGQGIAVDVLPFVFDRFRQADSSTTRLHSGLGLGLALVKHLVDLHGGTVTADSPGAGKGATFSVRLPRQTTMETPVDSAARRAQVESGPAGVRLDGLRILVVDDDPDALDVASEILNVAGATVKICASAPDALALVREWRPDVLVADIAMPGEDGYSLIRKVRSLDESHGGKIPAIALTAYGRVDDRVRALTAGYTMHVPKPVDPGELTGVIASAVELR